jgi:hypothetical protein
MTQNRDRDDVPQSDIADVLRQLDRSTDVPEIDPDREAALLAAFDARGRLRRPVAGRVRWFAVAAAILIAAGVAVWMRANRIPVETPAPLTSTAPSLEMIEFMPWPGASALPRFESGQLVRMDLPASMLPSLGVFPPASDAASVRADVLIGQDGLARAVRLLP